MSAVELQNFESQLSLLSFAERLSIIDYLVKSMQDALQSDSYAQNPKKDWVDDLFALMDAHPIDSNGQKWTREELYESFFRYPVQQHQE
ncbi:MAG: hypothetical protein II837_15225 [Treponema sp.]|nr:hypothetical protein [Treponema sp.]MBQ6567277.1 hypothetical protein [Treponema sp.]MBQ7167112.1 hypothetical protein [Treponema sp.]